MTETNPLELFNEINGIVERIQWNRSAIPMPSSHQSASFHHFICQSFSFYLPIFFTLSAILFQETCQKAFPPSPSASSGLARIPLTSYLSPLTSKTEASRACES